MDALSPAVTSPADAQAPAPSRGHSIAWHLAMLSLALLLPVLVLAGALGWSYAASERARIEEAALAAATDASLAVERELAGLIAATEVLALSRALRSGDLAGFDAEARAVRDRLGVNVVMRDRDSRQVVNTRLPPGAPLPVGNSRGSDERVLESRRPDVSDIIQGAVANRPLFIVNVPVERDGRVAWFLNLSLEPGHVRRVVEATAMPAGSAITVVDRRGLVLADTRPGGAPAGAPLSPALWAPVAAAQRSAPEGIVHARLPAEAGGPLLVAHLRSPLSGWTTIVSLPAAVAAEPLHRSLAALALLALGLLALAGGLAAVVARRIAGPVMRLAEVARGLGEGATPPPAATPVSEASAVAEALSRAAAELGRRAAALGESEARLRLALEAGGLGSWEVDLGTGLTTRLGRVVPPRPGLPLGGYTLEEFFARAVHPDDVARLRATFAEVARGATARYRIEYRVRGPDDAGWIWMESYGGVVERDPASGAPRRLAGVSRDVSDRKAAEAALAESEQRLSAVLEQMPVGVAIAEVPSGRLLYHNRRGVEILGHALLPAEAIGGYARYGALHADLTPYAPEDYPLARTVAAGATVEAEEMLYRRGDGTITCLEVSAAPVRDAAGTPALAVSTFADVSARKAAERAIERAKERLEIVLRGADLGTWHWNVPTGEVEFNARWAEMLGYDLDEIEPHVRSWERLLHPDERAHVAAVLEDHLEGRTPFYECAHRLRRKDGGWAWVLDRGRVVERDAEGRPLIATGTHLDITARKEAEERQMLLAREVNHRAKNALAVAQSIVALTRADDPAAYRRAVQGRIGALARAHTRLAEEGWTGADLRSLLEDELAGFAADAPAPDAASHPRVTLSGPAVTLPPEATAPVAMIVHELATNALKHGALSAPEGRVEIHWRVEEGRLRLGWREAGGPRVAAPPTRRGFGSRVLEATAGHQLGGALRCDWAPEGLRCELDFPLPRAAAGARPAPPAG